MGIGGVPGFNGYLSKTLLHEGLSHLIAESGQPVYRAAEVLFLFSGGLTAAYMLRLFVCVFVEKNADSKRQASYDAGKACLTPLSAAVLLASSALLLPMGVPQLATLLGERMSSVGRVPLEAFAWENLKGALISLGIGAAVYFGVIRLVLLRRQVRLSFDLEERIYRPLMLRWLPAVLGAPARWLGENVMLCRIPLVAPETLAHTMGENAVLHGLADVAVLFGVILGRLMDSSLDVLTLLLRRTALREVRVKDERQFRSERLRVLSRATVIAFSRVLDNFSFAMMMTCAGVVLVFALLVLMIAP